MLAEVLHEETYRAYRLRLEAFLLIPIDASELDLHQCIAAGFSPGRVKILSELSLYSAEALSQVLPLKTLNHRVARGQRFTPGESDRLFRLAHVMAMAEAVFGDYQKAQRWLNKPKQRFAMEPPFALLSTDQGTRLVEQLLIQVAEGLAL